MNEHLKKFLSDRTAVVIGLGMALTPLAAIVDRNKKFAHCAPENVADENLTNLVREELGVILKRRRWRLFNAEPKNIRIEVQRDVESATAGLFHFLHGAVFRFSARLAFDGDAADAVATVRRQHPNILDMFKCNLGARFEWNMAKVWRNFRTALDFRDLANIFVQRDLFYLSVDSSALSDEDIRALFLSPNAKRFAIARELLDADRLFELRPFLHSAVAFSAGWFLCLWAKPKVRGDGRLVLAFAFCLSSLLFFLFDWADRTWAVVQKDSACIALGDDYVSGAKEYLQASIKLGKCIHRWTDGQGRFDLVGDFDGHTVPYSKRLQLVEQKANQLSRKKANKTAKRTAANANANDGANANEHNKLLATKL